MKEMKDHLKNKEQIQYRLKNISLNSQKDKLQQENPLTFALKVQADTPIVNVDKFVSEADRASKL
jgi:hypothetical protein